MRFDIYRNIRGEWSWRLIASNGKIVAVAGEGYKRRSTMIKTMRRVFDFGLSRTLTVEIERVAAAERIIKARERKAKR